ncbi:MAG: choice-of-anchor D domain-containing protein [Candidatus Kapabacteria bacterium]|nr:choice-of-anchor D domain-containing protein [Candidatus Kapabacteria bacterium]
MTQTLPQWLMTSKFKALALIALAVLLVDVTNSSAQCTYGWGNVYVTSPSAGQTYTRNTTMTIRWYGDRYTIGNYSGKYKAEYSSNGGGTWTVIDGAIDGYATSYNWLIPTSVVPGSNFYIRVSEVPGPSFGCAFSYPGTNGAFTIIKGCFPPVISAPPTSRTACVGTATTFSVTSDMASGTYEWRRNGVTLATTTSSSYTVNPVTLANAGLYDVILRDDCNPTTAVTTSGSCSLIAIEAPVITLPLAASKTVCQNANDTLRIRATGAGKTFQWAKNGVAIAGATDSNYVVNNATSASADGSYTCTVSGTCSPPAVSSALVLTVAGRPLVTVEPSNLDICPGTNGSISVTATGTNLTYQWYKDGVAVSNGFNATLDFPNYNYASNGQYYCIIKSNVFNPNNCQVTVQTKYVRVTGFRPPTVIDSPDTMDACVGSSVTLLSEFQGNGLSYQWFKNSVAVPNAASNSLTISPITPAAAGDYYTVATGTCGLTATTKVGKVVVISKPVLSLQPLTQKLTVGDRLTLSVNASDWRTIQWTKNDKPIAGATSPTYEIAKAGKGDAGYYNALVRNSCGGVASAYANITVLDPVTPEPALELSTMSVDFGEIPVGYDKSLTLNGLMKNVGTSPLTVSGLSTSPNEFTMSNGPTLPLTLAPGASAGVTIKCSPTVKGALSGALTVLSNSPSNPNAKVTLMASYVLRYDHAATQDYGVVLTDTSAEKCISLTNTSAVSITIEQATFTGANSGQFSVITTLPLTIAAGQSADLCVKFMPGTAGSKSATLNIRSSSGGNSTVALSGVGETPGGVVDAVDAGVTAWPNPMTDRVEIRFANATPAMEVTVVGSTGRTVASFSQDGVDAGGTIRWNGRDASGASVASGSYTMVIRYGGNAVSLPISIVR